LNISSSLPTPRHKPSGPTPMETKLDASPRTCLVATPAQTPSSLSGRIRKDKVPKARAKDVTYGLITCLVRPEKLDEPNRTRLVAGGDRVHYPGNAGTPTANLITVKIFINSIISTDGAKFMTMDIRDFYLNTPMARYRYMQLHIADMPDDVIEHYNLRDKATPDSYIYCKIQKGMYGLPQAGIMAQHLLKECLQKHGYHQSQTTPSLWKHNTRPINFSLVVNNFGVKYVGKENAQHLLDTVRHYYKCSCDWKGGQYCGLTLKWDYEGKKVHILMPRYVTKALTHFWHPPPVKSQDQPYLHAKPNYGAKTQHATAEDTTPPLDKAGKKLIQEVCGVFLFLARRVDGGLLPALSTLASQQANPTKQTLALCKQFLDYMASQDKAVLTYKASNMVLAIHSNISYLSKPKACSRTGGHMFMAGRDDIPTNNGAVLNILQIIQAVMSSAEEAELNALFINTKTGVSMRHTLKELGHPQPPTPIQTDNKTANDLLTNNIMSKALKVMDMHFHWLRCHKAQGQFRYYWRPGKQNLADYSTKHHPANHHKANRPTFLTLHEDPQYTKLFPPQQDEKSNKKSPTKPSTTTNSFTKSFGKNLLQTPRFKIKTINTVTAKSA
jgi:hypothetical protein